MNKPKFVFREDLKLYRAGCGCRMVIELFDNLPTRTPVRTCKRHQEEKVVT